MQRDTMQSFDISPSVKKRVIARQGRLHPYDHFDGKKTSLLVIDMQNYFVAPGYQSEVPAARAIVPNINRLADAIRKAGGRVIWIQTASDGTDQFWSHHFSVLHTQARSARRMKELKSGSEGFGLWPEMDARPEDIRVAKRCYSALIPGSSDLEQVLRGNGTETVLIAGTATNVCCESTARDAMMMDFKCIMIADGLAACEQDEHQKSLEGFLLYFGDVLTVEETIERFKVLGSR